MQKLGYESFIDLRILLSIEGIGPAKIRTLINEFKSLDNILRAGHHSLMETEGISNILAGRILKTQSRVEELRKKIDRELEVLEKIGGRVITAWDQAYPSVLKTIFDPPLILYILGQYTESDLQSLAIVGTRQPTNYGRLQADKFASEAASGGLTIVSGMARGIDSIAHGAALKNSGRTIAITGSGLDVIYPPENRQLYHQITENGAIITEYEPGTKPDAQNFPRRNRIISGLSLGTLVVETAENGGAMQTAAFALDQGREIFAIPGNLGSKKSEGTNLMIQRGEAKLVRNSADIFDELRIDIAIKNPVQALRTCTELSIFEEKIISNLAEPLHIDLISDICGLTPSDCLVTLLSLEFKGLVKQLPGKIFARM